MEVAGDPTWADTIVFNGRKLNENVLGGLIGGAFDKQATKTSFGDISMQVVVGAETLGYDVKSLNDHQVSDTISSLKNPIQNIYISAKHLSTLKDVDFSSVSAAEMSNDQIAITAERYNRGAGVDIADIKYGSNGYGSRILRFKNDIMEALK